MSASWPSAWRWLSLKRSLFTQACERLLALPAAQHDVLAVAVAAQQLEAGEALGFVDVALALEELRSKASRFSSCTCTTFITKYKASLLFGEGVRVARREDTLIRLT